MDYKQRKEDRLNNDLPTLPLDLFPKVICNYYYP